MTIIIIIRHLRAKLTTKFETVLLFKNKNTNLTENIFRNLFKTFILQYLILSDQKE